MPKSGSASGAAASRPAYVQTGGSQQSGDLTADGAGADDEQDLPAGHAAGLAVLPLVAPLQVVAFMEQFHVSEYRRQHELRDWSVKGAARHW